MRHKRTENARRIFAFMVPITIVAFLLAIAVSDAIRIGQQIFSEGVLNGSGLIPDVWDYIGMLVACVGVFLFNWYEEKPQPLST